jgi:23S rRNA pseudouridine1911/1915/1917 synthase
VNDGFEYRETVGAAAAGRCVLHYLSDRYRHSSIETWRDRLARGQVLLDGLAVSGRERMRAGQVLVWRRPPWTEPAVPLAFAILYRDADLLAVAKPRGLPSVPNGGFLTHTLLHIVRVRYPEATPLHRLGRGTSGLVLFARSEEARKTVARAWRDAGVKKTYRALVSGVPREATFTVDVAIGPAPHPRLGRVHAASANGKPALTHVRVLRARGHEALVEAVIPTGRPHQIRIHLAAAGHPLVGDPLYAAGGLPRPDDPGLPGDLGYRLHALRLELGHPRTGRPLTIECAPPEVLRDPVSPAPGSG